MTFQADLVASFSPCLTKQLEHISTATFRTKHTTDKMTLMPRVPTLFVLSAKDDNNKETSSDDYDDWYADFDPSKFESYSNNNFDDNDDYNSDYKSRNKPRRNNDFPSGGRTYNHGYQRDPIDQSNVKDMDTVNFLLAERLHCRKTRQFDRADAIRDELLAKHGVLVRDKDRMWRTGGSPNGSGRKWLSEASSASYDGDDSFSSRRGGRRSPKRSSRNDNSSNNDSFTPRDFGPNGHDYQLAVEAGPQTSTLSMEQINLLIKQRLEAKLNRDFKEADRIQAELLQGGVFVHDGRKEWRADGQAFDEFSPRKYSKSEYSMDNNSDENEAFEKVSDKEIQTLVNERSKAKAQRLYRKADQIKEELLERYNVHIQDRLQQWSIGGNFGEPLIKKKWGDDFLPYKKSARSESPANEADIQKLLEDRDIARANRDFVTADKIRNELFEQNIYINDGQREWSVGDLFSNETNDDDIRNRRQPRGASKDTPPSKFKRLGGGTLSKKDEETITMLLNEREQCQRNRRYAKADQIRARLREEFQVRIDDRSQEWHVVTSEYIMSQNSAPMDNKTQEFVQSKISERAVAKLNKDYDTADGIRDELMVKYNVSIDDRTKEWTKLGGYSNTEEGTYSSGEIESPELDDVDYEYQETADYVVEDLDYVESRNTEKIDEPMSIEELNRLTIPELKERLRAANLPVSGRKADLIERLTK